MLSGTMHYEDIKPKVSKGVSAKVVERSHNAELSKFHTSTLVWFVVKRHKFGLLVAFTIIYVSMTAFHTLIIGLIESFK